MPRHVVINHYRFFSHVVKFLSVVDGINEQCTWQRMVCLDWQQNFLEYWIQSFLFGAKDHNNPPLFGKMRFRIVGKQMMSVGCWGILSVASGYWRRPSTKVKPLLRLCHSKKTPLLSNSALFSWYSSNAQGKKKKFMTRNMSLYVKLMLGLMAVYSSSASILLTEGSLDALKRKMLAL